MNVLAPERTEPIGDRPPAGHVRAEQPGSPSRIGASEGGWLVVALAVLAGGISAWSLSSAWAWGAPVSLALDALALVAFVTVLAVRRCPRWTQLLLLCGAATVIAVHVARAVLANPAYGTDEAAFSQFAAALLLRGGDPYTHSMLHALAQFHVPDGARTYLSSGQLVGSFSYPALAFLPGVPLLALGVHAQTSLIVTTVSWILTMGLCWALLPARLRFCAPLVGLGGLALGYVASGLIDPIELPFLLLAVWKWDRFCDPASPVALRAIGPICLGLASAVKQTPWLIAPFLILAIALESHSRNQAVARRVGSYVGWAAVGFLLPNVAFIAWAPATWLKGVLVPLVRPTVAGGQGIVSLVLLHGGGPIWWLNLAGLSVLLAGLCATVAFYHRLRGALVVLAACALLVPARSFGSYVVFLAPAALVGALSLDDVTEHRRSPLRLRRALVVMGSLGLASGLALVASALTGPAVSLDVASTTSMGNGTVGMVSLDVTNRSASRITPHFVVSGDGELGAFWPIVHGPRHIAPHSSATVEVEAPDVASMPGLSAPVTVDAFVGSDVAATRLTAPSPWRVTLEPEVVSPVPRDRPLELRAQLTNALGQPQRRSGVRIALTQVSYGPRGAYPAEASINAHQVGRTPVVAVTDRSGVAVFAVRSRLGRPAPVFFQAWVVERNGSMGTQSNQVLVHFLAH